MFIWIHWFKSAFFHDNDTATVRIYLLCITILDLVSVSESDNL